MKLFMLRHRKNPDNIITLQARSQLEARAAVFRATGERCWLSAKQSSCEIFSSIPC